MAEGYFEMWHQSMFPLLTYRTPDQVFYLPSTVHFADVSKEGNAMKTKTNQHINEGGMDSWSNKQGVIERYTRGRLADASSGGSMLLEPSNWFLQTNLHRFVWRKCLNEPLKGYRMTRVTFECQLPHLLQTYQWSGDFFPCCPLAAQAMKNSFYVDDCLTGTDTVQDAIELQEQLQELLLRKWNTSKPTVLLVSYEIQPDRWVYKLAPQLTEKAQQAYTKEPQLRSVSFDCLQVAYLGLPHQTTSRLRHRQDIWCFGMVFSLNYKNKALTSALLGAETQLGWSCFLSYVWRLVQLAV